VRERDLLEDTGVDGRIILRRIFRMWDGGADRIDLAEDWNGWRALVCRTSWAPWAPTTFDTPCNKPR